MAGRSAEHHEIRRLRVQAQNVTDKPFSSVTQLFHTNTSNFLQAEREVFENIQFLSS